MIMGLAYKRAEPPNIRLFAVVGLTSITAGFMSLIMFALRGAVEEQWRFSLRGLLVATTLIALALGLLIVHLRGS
jgi:hypothetical protein